MGVRAPRGQRLPSDTVWASPPSRGPGFVRGNHTPLHGNASALCCFGIERGHCSPSILHGRVTECGGPVPPPRLRWAGRSPTAGQAASTPDSFPQMGRCGDRASLARGAWGLPPVRWRQDTQTDSAAGAGPAEVTLCPRFLCREAGMAQAMAGVSGQAGGVWGRHPAPGQAQWDSRSCHRLRWAIAVSMVPALGMLGAVCVQLSCAPVTL